MKGRGWQIPTAEISALCVRHDAMGRELLAVGDARWAVATVAIGPSGASPGPVTEVGSAIAAGGLPTGGSSEFEGVASDASERVFLLQEGPARVLVLDPEMSAVQHTISLHVDDDDPDIGESWADETSCVNPRRR